MKKLPIGKQDFRTLIEDNYVYVDKTELIFRLIDRGSVYFLSRPRRFGKSLTISTLEEIFRGNKELFKGLWIYAMHYWQQYPVIRIDFSKIGYKDIGLTNSIENHLCSVASEYKIKLNSTGVSLMFNELIEELSKKGQVAILIDEYDKPIIDYLEKEKTEQAVENREILKNFYSVLKGNDANIKFLFITGVSKFSKVSVFSDLNHLSDITLNPNYAALTGYTHEELNKYFSDYMENSAKTLGTENIIEEISNWYDGYSWDGKTFVFNPFSILNFFDNNKFEDYWFRSGTPTFLMKLIKEKNYNITNFSGFETETSLFEKYDITDIELIPLLFQTGYLTIKKLNPLNSVAILDYPNNEVRKSFENYLLSTLSEQPLSDNRIILQKFINSLKDKDVESFIQLLKILFKSITYPLIRNEEAYYHSLFYTLLRLMGFDIETEMLTIDGRIDAVVKTEKHIYILEFKMGTAEDALAQIKKKEYALKYAGDRRKKILLGIGFSAEKKNVGDYLQE